MENQDQIMEQFVSEGSENVENEKTFVVNFSRNDTTKGQNQENNEVDGLQQSTGTPQESSQVYNQNDLQKHGQVKLQNEDRDMDRNNNQDGSSQNISSQDQDSISSIIDHEFENIIEGSNGKYTYYCDQNRQWAQHMGNSGYKLMNLLIDRVKDLLRICCRNIFNAANANHNDISFLKSEIIRGKDIYGSKESYKKAKNKGHHTGGAATWSEEEYKDPAFHFEYLKLKSMQRFTENYNLLERCYNEGMFDKYIDCDSPVRLCIASLGGGPGYELFAFRCFAEKHFSKNVNLRLVSMDLEERWGEYAIAMGNEFIKWDLRETMKVESFVGEPVHFIMLSYVVYHYMNDEKTSKQLADLISREHINAALVNSRSRRLNSVSLMSRNNVQVLYLLDQILGRDDRQTAYLNPTFFPTERSDKLEVSFPNVPYTDDVYKGKRKRIDHNSDSQRKYHQRYPTRNSQYRPRVAYEHKRLPYSKRWRTNDYLNDLPNNYYPPSREYELRSQEPHPQTYQPPSGPIYDQSYHLQPHQYNPGNTNQPPYQPPYFQHVQQSNFQPYQQSYQQSHQDSYYHHQPHHPSHQSAPHHQSHYHHQHHPRQRRS